MRPRYLPAASPPRTSRRPRVDEPKTGKHAAVTTAAPPIRSARRARREAARTRAGASAAVERARGERLRSIAAVGRALLKLPPEQPAGPLGDTFVCVWQPDANAHDAFLQRTI